MTTTLTPRLAALRRALPPAPISGLPRRLAGVALSLWMGATAAQPESAGAARAVDAMPVPAPVRMALARAGLPEDALAAMVVPLGAAGEPLPPRLSVQPDRAMPPASVMKLITTAAALDLLGPAWVWRTPVELHGALDARGVLHGSLVIRGRGDPSLVIERLWLLLQRVRALGVREIAGDIVLDQRAFEPNAAQPGDFDGEPLEPYNALPQAFTVNHQSVMLQLRPAPDGRFARLSVLPTLAGVRWPERVALQPGPCGDWRRALQLDLSVPSRPRVAGRYPASCGEREWPVAWPTEASAAAATSGPDLAVRAIAALWRQLGGRLHGHVIERRDEAVPTPDQERMPTVAFEAVSPPLAEVVRDINKFSNNLMARQLFLTLGLHQGAGTLTHARSVVADWAQRRAGCDAHALVLDNGSGLSRTERASAACLARVLQAVWASPTGAELIASLPVLSVDGTAARRSPEAVGAAAGRAHIKTGSLDNVAAAAGVVLAASGRRYAVVGLIHHPATPIQAAAARAALDALLRWSAEDTSP